MNLELLMIEILPYILLILLILVFIFQFLLWRQSKKSDSSKLFPRKDDLEKVQEKIERSVREEAAQNREELSREVQQQRQELIKSFKTFGDSVVLRMTEVAQMQKNILKTFTDQLDSFEKVSSERLGSIRTESASGAKSLREEVVLALKSITESTTNTIGKLSVLQKTQLESMSSVISELSITNEKKLESLRGTVEEKLQSIQHDNAIQIEQMRQTVDEKLQGTLEKRLGESFKQVSERLELVHQGLGEMQMLASGVGDLKKVLSNVKTRGTWGEVQLGVLLEQVLHPDQYASNVATKGGNERVEYAIKLPGQGPDLDQTVWLPIDAKFPIEDYQRLLEAQENTDLAGIDSAGKQLENRVKSCAQNISNKYLNPPHTTDFGILFLPIESLFAEVIQRTGLIEVIQREYRVVIAGPTTLWSILSSLQMGFRTLAIQKRSSEVWNLLAAVKTEWTKYGDVLEAVQKKINQASNTIEKVKVRSRAVGRKLRDVQVLPIEESASLLSKGKVEKIDGEIVKDLDANLDLNMLTE
jgi:DNA recombination protein RmuC